MIDSLDLPQGITIDGDASSGPIIEIATPACTARVSLHGGHVLAWKPAGHSEVLWLSPAAIFRRDKAIRGGIPVCWPWFGDHPGDPNKPSHGFVRTRQWQLIEAARDPDGIRISLSLPANNADLNLWPHDARPTLDITAGNELTMVLTTINSGPVPLEITEALHTYFAVDDIEGRLE